MVASPRTVRQHLCPHEYPKATGGIDVDAGPGAAAITPLDA